MRRRQTHGIKGLGSTVCGGADELGKDKRDSRLLEGITKRDSDEKAVLWITT